MRSGKERDLKEMPMESAKNPKEARRAKERLRLRMGNPRGAKAKAKETRGVGKAHGNGKRKQTRECHNCGRDGHHS